MRMRVGARLVAERLELDGEVLLLLAGEPRKGRVGASAIHAVAGGADMLGVLDLGDGGGLVRPGASACGEQERRRHHRQRDCRSSMPRSWCH
jgi:hypothetical protein